MITRNLNYLLMTIVLSLQCQTVVVGQGMPYQAERGEYYVRFPIADLRNGVQLPKELRRFSKIQSGVTPSASSKIGFELVEYDGCYFRVDYQIGSEIESLDMATLAAQIGTEHPITIPTDLSKPDQFFTRYKFLGNANGLKRLTHVIQAKEHRYYLRIFETKQAALDDFSKERILQFLEDFRIHGVPQAPIPETSPPRPIREWKYLHDGRSWEGHLLSADAWEAKIEKRNGDRENVKLAKLSNSDWEYLASVRRSGSPAPAASLMAASPEPDFARGQERKDNALGLSLVWFPAGKFLMGSARTEPGHTEKDYPIDVTLSYGFWIGKTELTQGQWKSMLGTNPVSRYEPNVRYTPYTVGDNLPVCRISHKEALEFCEILTDLERSAGRITSDWTYTLPTEAQWEYACRAGTTTAYSFGDDPRKLADHGWAWVNLARTRQKNGIQPVGKKKPNPAGLFDMHGNVSEYCLDLNSARELPGGVDPLLVRGRPVARGGSYDDEDEKCRSASFVSGESESAGIRVALVRTKSLEDLSSEQKIRRRGSDRQLVLNSNVFSEKIPAKKEPMVEPSRVETIDAMPGVEMVWCPAGKFLIGSPLGKPNHKPNESQAKTSLSNEFWISKTEITEKSYRLVRQQKPVEPRSEGDRPHSFRFEDAVQFCEELTEQESKAGKLKEGYVYRLPTEAEWEYACRAGTTGYYFWGDDHELTDRYVAGVLNGTNSERSDFVASKQPNSWGLFDMLGNMPEWCLDTYQPFHQGGVDPVSIDGNPASRVVRSFFYCAQRYGSGEIDRNQAALRLVCAKSMDSNPSVSKD